MSLKRLLIGSAACVAFTTSTAGAAVITFDGFGPNYDDPVVVDGYNFNYIDNNGWGIGEPVVDLTNQVGNGTDIISCRDTVDANCAIVMTLVGGGTFSVAGFDGADGLFGVGGRTIQVTGSLFGGGSVVQSFATVADVFTSYSLSTAFTNLISIEFRGFGAGDDMMAFDNIDTSVPVAVPEPATLSLLAFGLLGAALGWRRSRQSA